MKPGLIIFILWKKNHMNRLFRNDWLLIFLFLIINKNNTKTGGVFPKHRFLNSLFLFYFCCNLTSELSVKCICYVLCV